MAATERETVTAAQTQAQYNSRQMADQLDELTGALGRAEFTRRLELLQRQYAEVGGEFAIAMMDLDHLKTINDVYGHAAGDAAIRTVAMRCRHVLRATDLLFRYGGDEFVILLPDTGQAEATAVLKRVRAHITANPIDAGQQLAVTVSLGVASSAERRDAEVTDVLLRADSRLLQAKRAGRNSLASEDGPVLGTSPDAFSQTRLFGRDSELTQLDSFLGSRREGSRARTLQLQGVPGSGLSRLMLEAGIRARLKGLAVRHLDVKPQHRSLHLRALELAYSDEISADASTEALAIRLRNDAETHGLVILLENGRHLDPGSRQLLAERLQSPGTLLIEAVNDVGQATFPAGQTLAVNPLSRRDALSLLGAATAGPVEPLTGNALVLASAGLPALMERLVNGLMESGRLRRTPAGLSGTPEDIEQAAERLQQEAAVQTPRLPEWDSPLVGRNQFLELIRPTVRANRLLVLTGPGGIGKSRLAAQLALELSQQLPGGAGWVDLRGVNQVAALPRLLCNALELPHSDELAEVLRELGDSRRLVVFDEADGIAGSAGVFSELLDAAPQLQLLVTSRMPLRLANETVVEVPELASPASVELFRHGMRRQGAERFAGRAELEDLIAVIGHVPLSIELAAAWTRAYSPARLVERLAEQPGLLDSAPGIRTGTSRFIDVTRQLMSEAEQEALGTLALAPAGFTLELAEQAAGASPFFILALLERALLRREDSRYTVHAAIAERYRAGLRDPVAARQRLAAAMAALARQVEELGIGLKTLTGYRQLDREEANLRFAWQHLLEPPQPELLWPLVQVMRGYLDVRGRKRLGLELFSLADERLADCADLELRGWVRESVALFQGKLGMYALALDSVMTAHELLERHGPPGHTRAMAWNTTGLIRSNLGDQQGAYEAFNESARIRRDLGDRIGEAQARGNAVFILDVQGRAEEALEEMRVAVANYREVGHLSGLSIALGRQASMMNRTGSGTPGERERVAREGAELGRQLGYATGAMTGFEALAIVMEETGRPAEAAAAFEEAAYWAELDGEAASQARLLAEAARLRRAPNSRS